MMTLNMDTNDQSLLQNIVAQNQQAMEVFYHRFSSLVYRFAMRTLNSPVDAAEVVNEVMMEVWRKAHTFEEKSSIKTWLLSITHHKSVDLLRKSVRHEHESDEHLDAIIDPICPITKLQDALSNQKYVQTCLQTLSDSHRQVVQLTFFDELSYPEISEILAVPSGTIKTRIMHAKKQLLACVSRLFDQEH